MLNSPTAQGVVAGESINPLLDGIWERRLYRARVVVGAAGDVGAVLHAQGPGVARVDDGLERGLVPAGDEVGVRAEPGPVAVGEDEGLLLAVRRPLARELLGVVVHLVEHMRNVHPALGAVLPAVGPRRGVCHVVLVVIETNLWVITGRHCIIQGQTPSAFSSKLYTDTHIEDFFSGATAQTSPSHCRDSDSGLG